MRMLPWQQHMSKPSPESTSEGLAVDLRRSPSSWSDWSDPGENQPLSPESMAEEQDIEMESRGITIPYILQPLLGLEFVPYLPKPAKTMQDNHRLLLQQQREEEKDSITITTEPTPSHHHPFNLQTALEHPTNTPVLSQPNNRQRFFGESHRKTPFRNAVAHILHKVSPKSNDQTPKRRNGTRNQPPSAQLLASQLAQLNVQQTQLALLHEESERVRQRATQTEEALRSIRNESIHLQQALQESLQRLQTHVHDLRQTRDELLRLETRTLAITENIQTILKTGPPPKLQRKSRMILPPLPMNRRRSATEEVGTTTPQESSSLTDAWMIDSNPPLRQRANTEPTRPRLRHSSSSSFMRISDLEMKDELESNSSISFSQHSFDRDSNEPTQHEVGMFFIDENITLVLEKLTKLGYQVSTDESEHFHPTKETQRLLARNCRKEHPIDGWPVCPWYVPSGEDILVWTGDPHKNFGKAFGHDWPVVKARGIVHTDPLTLVEFLLDSSQIKTYNRMSQGRDDVLILQEGVNTKAEDSDYGFPGMAKIMRAFNKPKLLPKTIEVLSLWCARPLENAPGSYIVVSRSVWEDETAKPSSSSDMLRSEMLLGVFLVRPCPAGSELTTITHVYSPGVPEMMAKRMAPSNAASMVREIQSVFHAN